MPYNMKGIPNKSFLIQATNIKHHTKCNMLFHSGLKICRFWRLFVKPLPPGRHLKRKSLQDNSEGLWKFKLFSRGIILLQDMNCWLFKGLVSLLLKIGNTLSLVELYFSGVWQSHQDSRPFALLLINKQYCNS